MKQCVLNDEFDVVYYQPSESSAIKPGPLASCVLTADAQTPRWLRAGQRTSTGVCGGVRAQPARPESPYCASFGVTSHTSARKPPPDWERQTVVQNADYPRATGPGPPQHLASDLNGRARRGSLQAVEKALPSGPACLYSAYQARAGQDASLRDLISSRRGCRLTPRPKSADQKMISGNFCGSWQYRCRRRHDFFKREVFSH